MNGGERQHGTHTCYVHGPDRSESGKGCRCEPCRKANSEYERQRARRVEPAYVAAGMTRAHVRDLMAQGVGLKTIAKQSGVSHGALSKLIYGDPRRGTKPSKRIRPTTRDRIMAVAPSHAADGARVDATRTWQHIDTLLAAGWTKTAIGRAIGQAGPGLQLSHDQVQARHARTIAGLLEQDPPERWDRWGNPIDPPVVEIDPPIDVTAYQEIDRYELPTLPAGAGDWIRRGACRITKAPSWLFFPDRGDTKTMAAAKGVCATCSVKAECPEVAIANGEPGVWGGTSEVERNRMTGRRKATA